MQPFEHQADAIEAAVFSLQERQQALVIMATGLGKTLVAASTLKRLKKRREHLRNLVLCHDTEILEQSEPTFRAVMGKSADIGYFTGATKTGPRAEIVFSTFQTLRGWKHAFDPDEFDLITVDESHHSQAPTYKDVIDYFSGASVLGLTATRDRMDGKDIADIFGKPVYDLPLEEAIVRGLLTPFEYRLVSDGLNAETIRQLTREIQSGKRFTLADLNKRLFIEARDEEIVRRILAEAGRRKSLVFCRNIKHADRIAVMLGPKARSYHSGATRAVNRDSFAAFRKGDIQFLVAVNKANEGVDIPDAEIVVFLRTTESKTIFFQQLGRSLRKLPGKEKSLILDFVGNLERISMLQDFIRKVGELRNLVEYDERQFVSVSGDDFEFNFSETIVEVLNLVTWLRRDFYPTWQEASVAAQRLEIKTAHEYWKRYKEDTKLPSRIHAYPDFPGWPVFLGGESKNPYSTWQEASEASIKLGIKSQRDYHKRHKEDHRLPGNPRSWYADFPGDYIFFGRVGRSSDLYPTCEEASTAAKQLGIKSGEEYKKSASKKDPRLPRAPNHVYEDFPGWPKFLGVRNRWDCYSTWQEAGAAAARIGITGWISYRKKYKKDPRLPAGPHNMYRNFPGIRSFLGKK